MAYAYWLYLSNEKIEQSPWVELKETFLDPGLHDRRILPIWSRRAFSALNWLDERETLYHIECNVRKGVRSDKLRWTGRTFEFFIVVYDDITPVLLKMFYEELRPYDYNPSLS